MHQLSIGFNIWKFQWHVWCHDCRMEEIAPDACIDYYFPFLKFNEAWEVYYKW